MHIVVSTNKSNLGFLALAAAFLSPVILGHHSPTRQESSKKMLPPPHWCSCLTCSPGTLGSWYGDCPVDVKV